MGALGGLNSAKGNYTMSLPLIPSLTLNVLRTHKQDWVCEACDAIYPLLEAILQYTIETLVLDGNILRDSILVRLEMVCTSIAQTLFLSTPNPNATLPCTLGSVRGFHTRQRHYVARHVPGVAGLDERQKTGPQPDGPQRLV
jgi:hypothetical protein